MAETITPNFEQTQQSLHQLRFNFDDRLTESRNQKIEELQKLLPDSHKPYTDKYFLRTRQILEAEGLNPIGRAQIFIRKGNANVFGLDEAIAMIRKYSNIEAHGGTIKALPEGSHFSDKETVLEIEGPVQDFVELETIYLGAISRDTTILNGGKLPDPKEVAERARAITALTKDRAAMYFGARHMGYEVDAQIAKATFDGGFVAASTDIAAEQLGLKGQGTIPHFLENIMAAVYGKENAVVEATKAFDKHIDPSVPRIALIDYNNREITDSLATAKALDGNLNAVRVDTCGENVAQGAIPSPEVLSYLIETSRNQIALDADKLNSLGADVLGTQFAERAQEVKNWLSVANRVAQSEMEIKPEHLRYWTGTGVTISGVYELRKALDEAGYQDVQIVLTSGFGKAEKVEAFIAAEKILGVKLFDSIGAGQLYESRTSTMDIVHVADSYEELDAHPMSKVGRFHRPNPRLEKVLPNS